MGLYKEAASGVVSAEALDLACAQLARGEAQRRLNVGRVAGALLHDNDHHELGFANVDSYAKERLGQSGAWLHESRRVADRLASLPETHAALAHGDITWKMAELLARHASADDESAILAAARRTTIREMAELLAECETAKAEADEERMCTVVRQVDIDTLRDCEMTSKLVDHLEGRNMGARWIEPVVAEATSTLHIAGIDPLIESVADDCATLHARRRAAEAARERDERDFESHAESRGDPMWSAKGARGIDPITLGDIPTDPQRIDALLQNLVDEITRADISLGQLARAFYDMRGWAALGFANFDQWIRERVGLSRATVWRKIRLATECDRLRFEKVK